MGPDIFKKTGPGPAAYLFGHPTYRIEHPTYFFLTKKAKTY